MPVCPFCKGKITVTIVLEGGYCPNCDELILVDYVEDDVEDVTEVISPEDMPTEELDETEELDLTSPVRGITKDPVDIKMAIEKNVVEESSFIFQFTEKVFPTDKVPKLKVSKVNVRPVEEHNTKPKEKINIRPVLELEEEDEDSFEDFGLDPSEEKGFSVKPKVVRKINGFEPLIGAAILLVLVVVYATVFRDSNEESEVTSSWEASTLEQHKGNEVETVELEEVKENKAVRKINKNNNKNSKNKKTAVEEVNGTTVLRTVGPTVKGPELQSRKGMSSDQQINKDTRKLKSRLKHCHTLALKTDPNAKGKWSVSFSVKTTGKISGLSIKTLRSPHYQIESCLKKRIKSFKYSPPKSSQSVKFSIGFGV
jgi:hypothetical protein